MRGKRFSFATSILRFPFMSEVSFFKIDMNSVLSKHHLCQSIGDCGLLTVSELSWNFRVDEHGSQVLTSELMHIDNTLFTTPGVFTLSVLFADYSVILVLSGHRLHCHHRIHVVRRKIGTRLGFGNSLVNLFSELKIQRI